MKKCDACRNMTNDEYYCYKCNNDICRDCKSNSEICIMDVCENCVEKCDSCLEYKCCVKFYDNICEKCKSLILFILYCKTNNIISRDILSIIIQLVLN